MIVSGRVELDIKKVPNAVMRPLAMTICEAAEAYFKIPEHAAAFQVWLEERQRQKAEKEETS